MPDHSAYEHDPSGEERCTFHLGNDTFVAQLRYAARGHYHGRHEGWEASLELNGTRIVGVLGTRLEAMRSLAEIIAYQRGSDEQSFLCQLPITERGLTEFAKRTTP